MRDPKPPHRLIGDATDASISLPVEGDGESRRSFLKLAGFGVATATLAGCSRGAVRFVVPRLTAEDAALPGRAEWIATTCGGCEAACGVLAKCRDGRPVKLEGNPDHAVSRGGLCAVGQASVLDLYDGKRTDGPRLRGTAVSWDELDALVVGALTGAAPGDVRLLTRTVISPSTRDAIARFRRRHGADHVEWDPRSASALLDAHAAAFGRRALPRIRFENADVIAAFDADFLGTWLSPVEFTKAYTQRRRIDDPHATVSRHVQIESSLTLTGGRADERIAIAPWERRAALAAVCRRLAHHAGTDARLDDQAQPTEQAAALEALADELWSARGKALLLCGSDDPGAQALAVYANRLLDSYGATLDLGRPSLLRRGDDRALRELIAAMDAGSVKLLVIDGLDPLYELPDDAGFREALTRVDLVITTAPRDDETTEMATAVAPTPHELESWGDAEATSGHLSLSQPTVPPLRSARTLRASLAHWNGESDTDDGALVRAYWQQHVHRRVRGAGPFRAFYDGALRDGYVEAASATSGSAPRWNETAWRAYLAAAPAAAAPADGELAVVVTTKVGLPESRHAHNAWLQELPDPLTLLTWDNCACIAPATAESLGVEDGDVVSIVGADGGPRIELPVRTVPGQHAGFVGVAGAYGVAGTDRFSRIGPSWLEGRLTVREGERVGRRAAPFLQLTDGGLRSSTRRARLQPTGESVELASTQDHHRLEVPKHLQTKRGARRDAVLATTLPAYRADPAHAVHRHEPADASLWPADHESDGPRWGLVIDLAACNGCSGCVVACQSENNVPCVGKDEVHRHREMTWLRMDRYFTGEGPDATVVHQPMMCQHCANAPCETVCPVLATVHSEDGLNQQIYNRCVGTRYCANNCPYKVRRFNWFDYPRLGGLEDLSANPDVTVRTRGVMEKCSMCVQRIQEGKAEARRRGEHGNVADGAIRTACQQSCPADAIAFGDLDDPESAVARLAHGHRAYSVLPELNVRPGVSYLADVRNRAESAGGERHE